MVAESVRQPPASADADAYGPGPNAGADGPDSDHAWRDWRDRRPRPDGIHFDNAAAGRSSRRTLAATVAHLQREAEAGPYVAQAEAAPVLDQGRADLAGLLGLPARALAFTESASAARARLLTAWPLQPGDTVGIVRSEWGPNMTAFTECGLQLTELAAEDDGTISLPELARLLAASPPDVVHLTQVASHRGLVQPVRAVAELCRAASVPLWVDAAQAIGHVDTASGADAIYATSRKWLTGPRGVGVLGIAERWWDRLRTTTSPLAREHMAAGASPVDLLESAEANVAGRVGLATAVAEYLAADPALVQARLAAVGRRTREVLGGVSGWSVSGPAGEQSAITTVYPEAGQDVTAVRERLLAGHAIVTTMASTQRAPREMTRAGLRVSPHVDCTDTDLQALAAALATQRG
jgi:pyridoxal 5-phosphate dependent beta-lyase